jgi:hypothetical protein
MRATPWAEFSQLKGEYYSRDAVGLRSVLLQGITNQLLVDSIYGLLTITILRHSLH